MDKILNKLKTSSIVTFVLAFIALSWIVLDYFVMKEILRNAEINFSLEMTLIIMSSVIFCVFIISVFVTSYNIFRFFLKYRAEEKKSKNIEKSEQV